MYSLPSALLNVIVRFAPVFSKQTWARAQVLCLGAILAPGKRTVTSALRVMGLQEASHFHNSHRVLNRAVWSSVAASRLLLGMLVTTFAPTGVLVMGWDDHIERRRGERLTAKGLYRDPGRSSHSHFVKASGLRWVSLMLLVPIPWAGRVWAFPFLTALCPSERYHQQQGRDMLTLTDRARQMLRLVKRWLPQRGIVVVADSSYAALEFLHAVREAVTMVTRLRLDAALYAPPQPADRAKWGARARRGNACRRSCTCWWTPRPGGVAPGGALVRPRTTPVARTTGTAVWYHTGLPAVPLRWVLVRDPQGTFDAQAFLCTALDAGAARFSHGSCSGGKSK